MPLDYNVHVDVLKFLSRFELDVCQLASRNWSCAVRMYLSRPTSPKLVFHSLLFNLQHADDDYYINREQTSSSLLDIWASDDSCCPQIRADFSFGVSNNERCLLLSDFDADRDGSGKSFIQLWLTMTKEVIYHCNNMLDPTTAIAVRHLFHHLSGCHVNYIRLFARPNQVVLETMPLLSSISSNRTQIEQLDGDVFQVCSSLFQPTNVLLYGGWNNGSRNFSNAVMDFIKQGRTYCTQKIAFETEFGLYFFERFFAKLCEQMDTLDHAIPLIEIKCFSLVGDTWSNIAAMQHLVRPPTRIEKVVHHSDEDNDTETLVEINHEFRNTISGQVFTVVLIGYVDQEGQDAIKMARFYFE